ncbi:Tyrosine recombinase XerC [Stieleria magnilauensis]|uniref:Tyrosine recombinase XerC n=1 Tax=Stieleria magnilauensis TaxID=2527963 RepID=A0ABX5Y4Y6_9BACT|nr:Tyrosine recombinase XerC [Planctomycetes bacterium TBK1r]
MRVSKTQDKSRPNTWKIRWTANRKRWTVTWTGDAERVEEARRHIEHILVCRQAKHPLDGVTVQWLSSLPDSDHSKLVSPCGVQAREQATAAPTLNDLYVSFKAFKGSKKQSTLATYRRAWNSLRRRFGEDRRVDSVTSIDAELFVDWMTEHGNDRNKDVDGLDRNTVRRRTGICSQFFRHAIKLGWITENPFDGLATTVSANKERFYYVSDTEYKRLMDFSPNATMRAVIALSRQLGFRIPSEIKTLRWCDVDLSTSDPHLRITAPKTEHHDTRGVRKAPLLASVRPYMQDLWDLAQPGCETPMDSPVFPRFADASETAIRSAVLKIMKRAKIQPWPNLFSNCRKSAILDLLAAGHEVADVAEWVGNSPKTIWDFYVFARSENRRRAAAMPAPSDGEQPVKKQAPAEADSECGPICGPIQEDSHSVTPGQPCEKHGKNRGKGEMGRDQTEGQWALRDLNPRPPRCKRGRSRKPLIRKRVIQAPIEGI